MYHVRFRDVDLHIASYYVVSETMAVCMSACTCMYFKSPLCKLLAVFFKQPREILLFIVDTCNNRAENGSATSL